MRLAPTFRIIGYAIVFVFSLLSTISIAKLVTLKEGENDCMRVYVQSGKNEAFVYVLESNVKRTHIDTEVLAAPVIGKAKGCIVIVNDNYYSSLVNSSYCWVEKVRKSVFN